MRSDFVESGRVALIRYTTASGARYVGSGLLVDERHVLTADHIADGTGHRVESAGWSRGVVALLRSRSIAIDLALLTLDAPVAGFTRLGCARVRRDRVDRLESCVATGFPRWKIRGEARTLAQVYGWIPTAEGLQPAAVDQPFLTLVGNRTPGAPSIPAGPDALSDTHPKSPWGGMSGAVVVADLLIVGVVRSHNLAEGGESLTVTPVTAVGGLSAGLRDEFRDVLGIPDLDALPALPRGPSAEGAEQPLPHPRPVGDWNPIRLGVHRAITVAGTPSDTPSYVVRDHDRRLRGELDRADANNVLVMLVGSSSSGKTRSAYEAVLDRLPNWQLVQPVTATDLVRLVDRRAVAPRTVVWLNETQTYLDGIDGEAAAAAMRRLLGEEGPVVVVGTLWPNHWRGYTRQPSGGDPDPHSHARQLLYAAMRIDVPEEFRADDMAAARELAKRDRRLAVAIAASGEECRVTQVLAGGVDLVHRWRDAPAYGGAVITAAVDARRLGHRGVLPAGLLRHAATAYLTARERAAAPVDWFEAAVAYAADEVKGAIAPLTPDGQAIGTIDGYQLADYLDQYGRDVRAPEPVPDALWQAVIAHGRDGNDLHRLAGSAYERARYGHALDLWRRAMAAGNTLGASTSAELLQGVGRAEEAADVLVQAVLAGNRGVIFLATGLLTRLGRTDDVVRVVRHATVSGDSVAAWWAANTLAEAGREDESEGVLREAVAAGRADARLPLARLLRERGRVGAAIDVLREAYAWGDRAAVSDLSELLAQRHSGPSSMALVAMAIARAAKGGIFLSARVTSDRDIEAVHVLARMLPEASGDDGWLGHLVERVGPVGRKLRTVLAEAAAGDAVACDVLATILARTAWSDDAERNLGAAVAAGDSAAARLLGEVRREAGRNAEAEQAFRQAAAGGDREAARLLGDFLWGLGRTKEAKEVLTRAAAGGDAEAADKLATLVQDDQEAIPAMKLAFEAGDDSKAINLIKLLAASGETAEVVRVFLARHGGGWKLWYVLEQLMGPKRTPTSERELRAAYAGGNTTAGRWLAGLLTASDRSGEAEDILRQVVAAGDVQAVGELADHLEEAGRDAEAEQVLRESVAFGDPDLLLRLADRLEETGRRAEAEQLLRTSIAAGAGASLVARLAELLDHQGRGDEATLVRQRGLIADGSTATSW